MSQMMGVRGLGHYYFGNWKRGLVEFRYSLPSYELEAGFQPSWW